MLNALDLEHLGELRQEEVERLLARRQALAQLPPTIPLWQRSARAFLARALVTLATAIAPGATLARPVGDVISCTC
jgi:hypothetical protein